MSDHAKYSSEAGKHHSASCSDRQFVVGISISVIKWKPCILKPLVQWYSVVLPSAHLKVLQTFSISTHTGQLVDTVSLEVELMSIKAVEVWISMCAASLKADWVAALDSVDNTALLSGLTPGLLTLHLLCCCITHTPLLTLWVHPEHLTWQVITVVVVTATAPLLDNTPDNTWTK